MLPFYLVGAWAVMRVAAWVRVVLALPTLFETALAGLLAVGVLIAVLLAWHFPKIGLAAQGEGPTSAEEADGRSARS